MIQMHFVGLPSSSELRQLISNKISKSMSHCSKRVSAIHVYLRDENGPKKGIDKSCRVVVHLTGTSQVVVEDRCHDLGVLLSRVSSRVRQTLDRRLTGSRKRGSRRSKFAIEERLGQETS